MKVLAKLLQLAGLGIPILAILAQLAGTITLGQMLVFAVAAICVFYIGRILEGMTGE